MCGEEDNYVAYKNGTIHLKITGACEWTPQPNRMQGYIQKKREPALIANEIEALMMSDVQETDTTPPNIPSGLKYRKTKNDFVISWEETADPTIGSWVVYYNVYGSGKIEGKSYGQKFILPEKPEKGSKYVITAVNAAGLESKGATITID